MAQKPWTDEDMAKRLWEDAKAQAIALAEMRGMAPGKKQLTPDEELMLFSKVADGWTVDKEMAMLAEGKTREEVGALKYPEREKLARQGKRALDKYEQAKYLADMARKFDPSWQPLTPKSPEPPPLPDLNMAQPAAPAPASPDPMMPMEGAV
jgi:hypothetical protein